MSQDSASAPRLADLFRLDGRTAVVSGGAGLLGSQITEGLAECGANIVVGSRDGAANEAFCKGLTERHGVEAMGLSLDIRDSESVANAVSAVSDKFGPAHILVNCSGFGKKNTWESISEQDWIDDVDVSLHGPFRVTRAFFPALKETRGVILNIASMYGIVAPDHRLYDGDKFANPPSYGVSKAGVLQFTRYLSSFLSPHGIRVNSLSPGPFPYQSTQDENPGFIERLGAKNPMGRIGEPHEVKAGAAYLCSDASSYVTGQNLSIDGGWTAW